jgi:DNA-binding MarR family transcriptional regulator
LSFRSKKGVAGLLKTVRLSYIFMVEANDFSDSSAPPVHPATVALRRLTEVTRAFENRLQRELTVNSTDLLAMQHLISRGPMAASALADAIHHSPAATTTVIDRLEALGHVRRERDLEDRRVTRVVPTAESKDKAEKILWEMIHSVDNVVVSRDVAEQDVITRYLLEVVDRYEAASRLSDQ